MTLVGAVPDEDEDCKERNRILELIWADDEVDESEPLPPSDSGGLDDSATTSPEEVSPPLEQVLELKRMVPTLAEIVVAQKDDPSAYGSAYARRDGIVLFHGRIYIPPGHWRQEAIAACHSLCPYKHSGIKKTRSALLKVFNWPGLHRDVHEHLAACPSCSRNKTDTSRLQGLQVPHPLEAPLQRIHLDHWSCPYNGKTWDVLTMVDSHTKWAEAVIVADKSAEATSSAFFRSWVCRFGVPRVIISDRGAAFTSRLFEGLARHLGSKQLTSSPYHPEGNAIVEAFHPRLSSFLRQIDQEEIPFPEALDSALFSYRATLHGSTQESPFYLTFGLDPSVGIEGDWRQRRSPGGLKERFRLLQLTRSEVRSRVQKERERDLARKNLLTRVPATFQL
ncbi:MAG: hypothetical protein KVP17_004122, partial [Porospora cf. gigantea B]|uniref:uncharacterized protein n=2 Tax=Porospora cf. gigantea B TaxID=2853592 RepID=UPI0035717AB6